MIAVFLSNSRGALGVDWILPGIDRMNPAISAAIATLTTLALPPRAVS
jgi:hypothetical protein